MEPLIVKGDFESRPHPFTHARFALSLARMNRTVSRRIVDMAEGMWNPDFCSDDAVSEAAGFIEEMREQLKWLEALTSSARRTEDSGPNTV